MRTVASEMGSNICILLYLNTIFEYLYLYLYLKATCYEYLYLYLNISEVFQKHQTLKIPLNIMYLMPMSVPKT